MPRDTYIRGDGKFYETMLRRSVCGCLGADCGRHGAYDPADLEFVNLVVKIDRDEAKLDAQHRAEWEAYWDKYPTQH